MKLLVKICGLRSPGDVEAAAAAGADLVGFVFVPGTRRAVAAGDVAWVREVGGVETVGVFRDQPLEYVLEVRRELRLDWVQLHGDEPDAWLDSLGRCVLRRVPVGSGVDWARVRSLAARCLPLIDPGAGDGVAPDWELLAGAPPGVPLGLAGGLTPENIGDAIRRIRPALVDVSSGVEVVPGRKDPERMAAFVAGVRAALRELDMV
ncbi:MAG: phosphoribosylanthranilate isomerase [Acidobacteria bacterium]|nr:phosphoribosylanthranilate isomerase [Acidobacteriota bacterium]